MAETITMPKLGFDMAEGTLVRWVRVEGETVDKGQVLAEIETDKATVEVEANVSGVVYKHLVEQGAVVPVGSPIAIIAAPGEKVSDVPDQPPAEKPAAPAEEAGSAAQAPAESQPGAEPAGEDGRLKASPLAKKVAEQSGVDLSQVKGTGPGGRIVRKDIEAALAAPKAAPAAAPSAVAAASAPAAPQKAAPSVVPVSLPVWGGAVSAPEDEHIPLNKLRAAIGRRMVESKQQYPHFYVTHTYNVEALMALRSQLNGLLPDDQKLTVNDFVLKAAA